MMMIFGAALLRARDTGSDQHEGDNVIMFQCRFFHAAHDLRAHSHRLDIDNKEHAWTGVLQDINITFTRLEWTRARQADAEPTRKARLRQRPSRALFLGPDF